MNLISKEGNLVRKIFGGGMALEFMTSYPNVDFRRACDSKRSF